MEMFNGLIDTSRVVPIISDSDVVRGGIYATRPTSNTSPVIATNTATRPVIRPNISTTRPTVTTVTIPTIGNTTRPDVSGNIPAVEHRYIEPMVSGGGFGGGWSDEAAEEVTEEYVDEAALRRYRTGKTILWIVIGLVTLAGFGVFDKKKKIKK